MSSIPPESREGEVDELVQALDEAETRIREEILGLKKLVALRLRTFEKRLDGLEESAGKDIADLRRRVGRIEEHLCLPLEPTPSEPHPDAHG